MELTRNSNLWFALYFHVCIVVNADYGRIIPDESLKHKKDYSRFYNLNLDRRIENEGYFDHYEVDPLFGGARIQVVAKIATSDRAEYLARDAQLFSKLNKALMENPDGSEKQRKPPTIRNGFIRFLQYFEKAEIQAANGRPLIKNCSIVFTALPTQFLSVAKTDLKSLNPNVTSVANEMKYIIAGMMSCIRDVSQENVISNRFHPSVLGIKREPMTRGTSTYRVFHTDFSFGSNVLSTSEEDQLYLKRNFKDKGKDFPIQWIGDEIEVLDLYSKKGNRRLKKNEKISMIYSVLLLVDELPFYTKRIIKILMKDRVHSRDYFIAICEIVRVHLTLVPYELEGGFGRLFRHYQTYIDNWNSLGMDGLIRALGKFFNAQTTKEYNQAKVDMLPSGMLAKKRSEADKKKSS